MPRETADYAAPGLALVGVGRRYGQAWAVRDVSLEFTPGHCTALIGENGAGKSTLLRILCGLVHPSEGHVSAGGRETRLRSPRDAERAGIAMIPQELAYVPHLAVAENIVMGRWPHRVGMISQRTIRRDAEHLVAQAGFSLDVRRLMSSLSLAERQLVEFVKVLARDAQVILLDEPTAALTEVETERLLEVLEQLKAAGKTLIYVSHRLDESFRIADRIAVMRDGRLVLAASRHDTSPSQVVTAMLGTAHRPAQQTAAPRNETAAEAGPALEVGDWRCATIPVLRGVSFSVAPGEILGVFGLIGSGIETVARGLGGHEPRIRGELRIAGASSKPFRGPHDARRAGIGYVPAERKSEGLALARPIRDNLTVQVLHEVDRLGFVRRRSETAVARQLISDFAINCRSLEQLVGELSGGNQQKVLLASRVAAAPRVLVLHEPTRGVDVGARAQIHRILAGVASRGAAVVVVTSDLAEAVELSDRLVVLREGRIAGRFSGEEKTRPNVLSAATHADESSLDNEEVER